MAKISCNVYSDILPLYVDDVVSSETRDFVENHLRECPKCREELTKMNGTITIPIESDATPFVSIKKQWAKKNTIIWSLSLALLTMFLLIALPVFDTAMQYHIQELIGGSVHDLLLIVLPLALVGFGIEWWLVHLKKHRWIAIIPLIIPAIALIFAEILWTSGGWDRFGSSILWAIGFPLLLGSGLAAILKATLSQPLWAKLALAAVLITFLILTAVLWPKYMYETIDVSPDLTMLAVYSDGEIQEYSISEDALNAEIQFAKMSPCNSAPVWNSEDCILVRLNDEYILAAQHDVDPYVYRYTGELEHFTGDEVCYRIYHYTALYMNLKVAGTRIKP